MPQVIKSMFGSKKWWVLASAVLVQFLIIVMGFGEEQAHEFAAKVVELATWYFLGQGGADMGIGIGKALAKPKPEG